MPRQWGSARPEGLRDGNETGKTMAADTEEKTGTETDGSTALQGQRKTRTGFVASDAMDKTVVVEVTRKFMHPMYKKYVRDRKMYKVHDEDNDCRVGDKVLIEETRPVSKHKKWRLREILERAPVV